MNNNYYKPTTFTNRDFERIAITKTKMNNNYYKPTTFTINQKQSDHIDESVYEDKKLPKNDRKYPNSQRSEYIRKKINEDMKDGR